MKDNTIRQILFGKEIEMIRPRGRSQTLTFPSVDCLDKERKYTYRSEDGFVLTLIKMIEDLESRIKAFEDKKK